MPAMTTLPDTLLINGTGLEEIPGVIVEDYASLHAPGSRRGDDLTIPGRPGDLYVDKVYAAYSFTIPINILPMDATGAVSLDEHERRAQYLANLRATAELVDAGLLVLTRRLAKPGGTYEDMTANGRYFDGLAPAAHNHEAARLLLQFVNLDGCWTAAGGSKHL